MGTIKYIATNNKVYIAHNSDNSIYTTNNINEATKWEDLYTCKNAVDKLPKTLKNLKFEVVGYTLENKFDDSMFDNINVTDIVSELENNFELLNKYQKILKSKLNRLDMEEQDILHSLEPENEREERPRYNVVQGYYILKELQDVRIERRKVKNDMIRCQILSNSTLNSWKEKKVSKAISKRFENPIYSPRIRADLYDLKVVS